MASFSVAVCALGLQHLVYSNWLHDSGRLRVIGTSFAATISFLFVLYWQLALRERHMEAMRRFELIAAMNDQIRNALQRISGLTWAAEEVNGIREAIETIDAALQGIVAESARSDNPPLKKYSRSA